MKRLPTLSTVKRAERLIQYYRGKVFEPQGGIYRDRILCLKAIVEPHYKQIQKARMDQIVDRFLSLN